MGSCVTIRNRWLIGLTVLLAACGGGESSSNGPIAAPPPPAVPYAAGPNVILILTDDMNAYADPQIGHRQALAPNLARLASRGVTFTNAHANATLCSPSRASLLSGYLPSTSNKYQSHQDFRSHPVLANAKLIPEHFRDNGYAAYSAGKVFHPTEEDFTVLGTSNPSSRPKWRKDRANGYVGPGESYGPTPWDGITQIFDPVRPSHLIPYGTEGTDWAYNGPYSITLSVTGRWNSNPDLPLQLQDWDQGMGRISNPPHFVGSMNSRYPAAHDYAGFATWDGPFTFTPGGPRSRMPDEDTAIWASELLRGIPSSNSNFSNATPINKRSFIMLLGLQKTHAPYYLPDEFFDDLIREFAIDSIDDVNLPPLLNGVLDRDADRSDVPPVSSKGSGLVLFRAIEQAAQTSAKFPDFVHAGQNIQPNKYRLFKSLMLAYLASIYEVDQQVGRILDAVDADPQLKANTIIIFTSDHGLHLGEKGLVGKNTLWNESTRVPLIIVDPRSQYDGSRGKRTDVPVSLVDLYPTLVGLAGLPQVRIASNSPALDGIDLRPALANPDAPQLARSPYAISSAFADTSDLVAPNPNLRNHTIRSAQWRYTLNRDGSEELYDEVGDRHEWSNLAKNPAYQQVVAALRPILLERTGRTD